MKKLLSVLFAVLFIFLIGRPVSAANSGLQLVTIPYETRADLDVLFAQSSRPLQYLDGEEVDKPTFIALVSESQKQTLTGKGYEVTVIDTDTDLDRYILLWHRERDKSSFIKDQGEIFVISPHYTLLKTPPGQPFKHEGTSSQFFDVPFPKAVATPIMREKTLEITQSPTPVPQPTKPNVTPVNYILPVVLALILLAITAAAVIYFKKKKEDGQSTDTPPNPEQPH